MLGVNQRTAPLLDVEAVLVSGYAVQDLLQNSAEYHIFPITHCMREVWTDNH